MPNCVGQNWWSGKAIHFFVTATNIEPVSDWQFADLQRVACTLLSSRTVVPAQAQLGAGATTVGNHGETEGDWGTSQRAHRQTTKERKNCEAKSSKKASRRREGHSCQGRGPWGVRRTEQGRTNGRSEERIRRGREGCGEAGGQRACRWCKVESSGDGHQERGHWLDKPGALIIHKQFYDH